MKKPKRNTNLPIQVKIESAKEFFKRGREVASALDKGHPIIPQKTIGFETIEDLMGFLAKNKITLIKTIRSHPASITHLARLLGRSRASIGKEVKLLEAVGIVKSEYIVNPGHGKQKIVKSTSQYPIKFQVQAII